MYYESYALTKYDTVKKTEKHILTVLLLVVFLVEYILFENSLEDKSEIEKEKKHTELFVVYLLSIVTFIVVDKLGIDFDTSLVIGGIMFVLVIISAEKE